MSEIVYSAQKSGFAKGRIYQNPRFFNGVLQPGATSVVIVGDWPRVKAAYEAADIPVTVVKNANSLPATDVKAGADNVSQEATTQHKAPIVQGSGKEAGKIEPPPKLADNVEIPENYADMAYRDLRALIAKLDLPEGEEPDISSKKDAVEFLDSYTKR